MIINCSVFKKMRLNLVVICEHSAPVKTHKPQWISLLYRRVQKIEQVKPDHCDIYQKNHKKK